MVKSPRRVRETSSSLRGWTPTWIYMYKSQNLKQATYDPFILYISFVRPFQFSPPTLLN